MSVKALTLLPRVTCPHCWTSFAPEDALWLSAHTDLLGDPRLGPEQPQRFLPTRFDLDGNALDARGFVCHSLACPKCHLLVPRAMLETEPLFLSILGTPGCGKSYFLTAMMWEARRSLALQFGLSLTDADTVSNRSLNEYEELLFLNPRADEIVPLADLIRKTELQGDLYDTVMYGNQAVSYPRPFLFALQTQANHLNYSQAARLSRVLCLYDNAGEHFQAGQDSTSTPVTQHLVQSRLLLFLFDPTQDQRFRRLCQERKIVCPSLSGGRTSRQESVLMEAAARVRRYLGLSHNVKHNRPLVVVVTKCDAWADLLDDRNMQEPWVMKDGRAGLNLERVERRSQELRSLLLRVCPEVVNSAENFAETVLYVPASALGRHPVVHPRTKSLAIRPAEIRPVWVTVPLLYGLCLGVRGLIPAFKRKQAEGTTVSSAGLQTADAGEARP